MPGFCERHQCHKTAEFFRLCNTVPGWFETWEMGRGPCTGRKRDDPTIHVSAKKESRGLGDTIAKVAHATGIAKVVEIAASAFGRPCGCNKRQEKLNEWLPYATRDGADHGTEPSA